MITDRSPFRAFGVTSLQPIIKERSKKKQRFYPSTEYPIRASAFQASACDLSGPIYLFSSNTGAEIMITSVYMCRQTDIHECVLMLSNGELLSQTGDDWLQRHAIISRTSITYLRWQLTVLIQINAWHTGV